MAGLVKWCQDNNLFLKINKPKEMIVDVDDRAERAALMPALVRPEQREGVHSDSSFTSLMLAPDLTT